MNGRKTKLRLCNGQKSPILKFISSIGPVIILIQLLLLEYSQGQTNSLHVPIQLQKHLGKVKVCHLIFAIKLWKGQNFSL